MIVFMIWRKGGENHQTEKFPCFPDAPVFVYVHGGYWQELNKINSAYCVGPLVAAGIKVIVLDYDLCPSITLEQIVNEMERAGDYILDYVTKTSTAR